MLNEEEEWVAEFEAVGESELRDRLYRGSGIHPEAKFHTAVRWLREQARARRLREPIEGSDKRRFFAVLHQPPVTSPGEAVSAAIVAERCIK